MSSREDNRGPSEALYVFLAVAALAGLFAEGCLERRDPPPSSTVTRCTTCHGDPDRQGDYLFRAAPPGDLEGSTEVSYPGVGAHQIHLRASPTHGPFACAECHVIPKRVASTGHADSARPAELVFGALSSTGDRHPAYDPVARVCADTYCHRAAGAAWTSPRSSDRACGTCHGLPPKALHPRSERCSTCHGRVIDAERHFVQPALHVNGTVEYDPPSCTTCHGSGEDPAPPPDTHGNTASSFAGVGAHRAHLDDNAVGRPLACTECHAVPDKVDASGHLDGVVQVVLSSVATSGGHDAARYDVDTRTCADTWCHGATAKGHAPSPVWTSSATLGCDSCHASPPPAPHPQMKQCSRCHGDVVGSDDRTIVDPARHVDGKVDVTVEQRCTACHGGDNPAPPLDTSGHGETTAPGVGAHQSHVVGAGRARAVPCETCHVVPEHTLDPGHIDTPRPAEVTLSGTAAAFGGAPRYAGGTCRDTSCHGAVFPDGNDSGGTNRVPTWTKVDGSQAACGACHGLPPPPPHPYGSLNPTCSKCHEDIAPDNVTFVHPELHVDGVVTFEVR